MFGNTSALILEALPKIIVYSGPIDTALKKLPEQERHDPLCKDLRHSRGVHSLSGKVLHDCVGPDGLSAMPIMCAGIKSRVDRDQRASGFTPESGHCVEYRHVRFVPIAELAPLAINAVIIGAIMRASKGAR